MKTRSVYQILLAAFSVIAFLLFACTSPLSETAPNDGKGSFTISVRSSGAARAALPWDSATDISALKHTIRLIRGGMEIQKIEINGNGDSAEFSVTPGEYVIRVEAHKDNALRAEGSVSKTIIAGNNGTIIVPMGPPFQGLTGITITTQPNKTAYHIGDELDLTGLVVKANYSSGGPYVIPVKTLQIEGFSSATSGTKTVTVSYGSGDNKKTVTFTVTVDGKVLQSIAVTNMPSKTTGYFVGDNIDLTGLAVTSTYKDENNILSTETTPIASVHVNPEVFTAAGTITVTITYGGKTATFTVTITAAVPVTGVTLNKTTLTLAAGNSETLTATVAPANATNNAVTWSTSNASVATVSNGTVTAVAAGNATITVTTTDGSKTATCTVTVNAAAVPVTGVTLNKTTLTLTAGSSGTLTATVAPSNATNKAVTWSTSNASVATVSNGTVTAAAAGNATITVTTADGSKTGTCAVTVNAPSNITINTQPGSTAVTVGKSGSVSVNASVAGGAVLSYQWYSNTTNSNSGGTSITGATSATYTIPTDTAGTYYYFCEVSATGEVPVRSAVAVVEAINQVNTLTWTLIPSGTGQGSSTFDTSSNGIVGIAYGNGKFVAVGFSGKMAYSPDGITWTAVSNSTFSNTNRINDIIYTGSGFAAVGYNDKMAYSDDGENWTAVNDSKLGTTTNTNQINGIAYGNSRFVVVGNSSSMAYSNQGW